MSFVKRCSRVLWIESLCLCAAGAVHAAEIRELDIGDKGDVAQTMVASQYVICDQCPPYPMLARAKKDVLVPIEGRDKVARVTLVGVPADASPGTGQEETGSREASAAHTMPVVYFGFDSANLSDAEKRKLLDIVDGAKSVSITGYTDKWGSKAYNDRLALRRARAVQGFLKKHGVGGRVSGRGKCCYVSDQDALNRRVEIRKED